MITCPKCLFQQPKDRYCAKCGVDVELYKPPYQSAKDLLLGIFKPLLIFFTIIFVVFIVLKKLNKSLNMNFEFGSTEVAENAQIGTQAESVKVVNTEADTQEESSRLAQNIRTKTNATTATPKLQAVQKSQPIQEYFLSVSLTETFLPESLRGVTNRALITNEPQIQNTFFSETTNIKDEVFTTRFEDEILVYDITVQITAQTPTHNTIKTILRRSLKTPNAAAIPNIENSEAMELAGFYIIPDTLPRDRSLQPTTNLLSVLAQSPNYSNKSSELAIIIHLEPLTTSDSTSPAVEPEEVK